MKYSKLLELKLEVSILMDQIHTQDHARNEKAIAMRKEIHVLLVKNSASYEEAYTILRSVIKSNEEFFAGMLRVRETLLAAQEGRESDAYAMIDAYYASQGLVVA